MDILIRQGGIEDTERYLAFLHDIYDGMGQSDWLFLDPDDEVRAMVEAGRMKLWLAEVNGIAGVFSVVFPGLAPINLGYDLELDKEQLPRVVHMDTAAVHPNYRGLHLQTRLMLHAEQTLGGSILLCTVHPENRYSLQNVMSQGYAIAKQCKKYGSIRYILRKDIL